jgi:hypothetical protein
LRARGCERVWKLSGGFLPLLLGQLNQLSDIFFEHQLFKKGFEIFYYLLYDLLIHTFHNKIKHHTLILK